MSKKCGEFGGLRKDGSPCGRKGPGLCRDHTQDTSPFNNIQQPKKRAYVAAFVATGGNITKASEAAGINRCTPYSDQWKNDRKLQDALELARPMAADTLEAEAVRRATEGVKEPVGWYQGEPGGYVQRYSDTLLIFLLKGARPERYRERHEFSGPGGGPAIIVREVVVERLSGDGRRAPAPDRIKINGR